MPRHVAENEVGRGIGSVAAVPRSPAVGGVGSGVAEDSIPEAGFHKPLVGDSASVVVQHILPEDKPLGRGALWWGMLTVAGRWRTVARRGWCCILWWRVCCWWGAIRRVLAGRHWVGEHWVAGH